MEHRESLSTGIIWKFIEKISTQIVSFIVSIVLARVLAPEDYGIIAEITIFITIADVFVSTGLSSALIQKKDSDAVDFSTIFYLNQLLSIGIYALIFLAAPYVAVFFDNSGLALVLRVLSVRILITSYNSIQLAYISKHMIFKYNAMTSFISSIISGIVGVVLAFHGYGVWALVFQQLSMAVSQMLTLSIIVKWRPQMEFSLAKARSMFGFGSNILAANFLDTISGQLRMVLVGRYYTAAELAYFNRGDMYPNVILGSINNTLHAVLFAEYSNAQDKVNVVKETMRKGIRRGTFLVFPMMAGLAVVARPLVMIMLTEKWVGCVPYLQVACAAYALWIIQIVNQEAITGLGYGKDYLIISVVRSVVTFVLLIIAVRVGVMAVAVVSCITNVVSSLLVCGWTRNKLNYRAIEQVRDIIPALGAVICVIISVRLVSLVAVPDYILLLLEVVVGIVAVCLFSILTNNDNFYWILNKIKYTFMRTNI